MIMTTFSGVTDMIEEEDNISDTHIVRAVKQILLCLLLRLCNNDLNTRTRFVKCGILRSSFPKAGVKCGCADVVTGNLRMLVAADKHPQITLYNIRTSVKYSCLINDAKSTFISLNVTVLATKKS